MLLLIIWWKKINDLSTAVAQLTAKSELQQKEIDNIKNGAISAPIAGNAADNGEGFQFSESEMKDLKGVITQFKRNETAYWGRSIKVSNIGSIPKEGSRFVSIKENLRKFGIEFLMTHAESFLSTRIQLSELLLNLIWIVIILSREQGNF